MLPALVSPLSMLQNPMILIAIVGLVVVVGMPYLLDNSTSSFLFPSFIPHSLLPTLLS